MKVRHLYIVVVARQLLSRYFLMLDDKAIALNVMQAFPWAGEVFTTEPLRQYSYLKNKEYHFPPLGVILQVYLLHC